MSLFFCDLPPCFICGTPELLIISLLIKFHATWNIPEFYLVLPYQHCTMFSVACCSKTPVDVLFFYGENGLNSESRK